MGVDEAYTLDDHEHRESDPYAGAKYQLTLEWLSQVPRGSTLLNIGCGGGVFNDLAHAAGYAVHGVEPDRAAFELAGARAAGRYLVEHKGVFDLGEDDAADVVVMHDVLEHIDAEAAAVRHLHALVRPGGLAVVSVPASELLFGYHDTQLGHFRRYSKASLRRCLSTQFEVVRLRYFGFSMIPVTLWYSRIRRRPYPVAAAQQGVAAGVVRMLCAVESRVPGPAGTSVLALVRREHDVR